VAAQADVMENKIAKNLKIFEKIDYLRSKGLLS
jgi:hypothetical protein